MTSQDILDALEYLHRHGMSDEQLNRLHHKKSPESFGAALKYWREQAESETEPREVSKEHGRRLRFVRSRHEHGMQDFARAIDDAWSIAD